MFPYQPGTSGCWYEMQSPTTLEYASSIYIYIYGAPAKDSINKTEAVQLRAVRFTTGDYQCTSSDIAILQQLQWKTLQNRQAYAQTVMMQHIHVVYNLVDIPAEHHLNRTSLRTRGHSLRFMVPYIRTTVYRTSYFPQAICLWNQVPRSAHVVEADTLDSFKAHLSRATLM